MMDEDKKRRFLTDLTAVSRQHGIVIGGCGCCGSPWVDDMDERYITGAYGYSSGGELMWLCASDDGA